jgi:hypothetical protein
MVNKIFNTLLEDLLTKLLNDTLQSKPIMKEQINLLMELSDLVGQDKGFLSLQNFDKILAIIGK